MVEELLACLPALQETFFFKNKKPAIKTLQQRVVLYMEMIKQQKMSEETEIGQLFVKIDKYFNTVSNPNRQQIQTMLDEVENQLRCYPTIEKGMTEMDVQHLQQKRNQHHLKIKAHIANINQTIEEEMAQFTAENSQGSEFLRLLSGN